MADKGRDRPNKGQDENQHTFVAPDGVTQEQHTMRWFRETGRAAGYTKLDDVEDAPESVEDDSTEAPA